MNPLSPKTTVRELLRAHPELLEFLAGYHPEFARLRHPALRATLGRLATLEQAAGMAGVPADRLLRDLRVALAARPGSEAGRKPGPAGEPDRIEDLKRILRSMRGAEDLEKARAEVSRLLQVVTPGEIARMEQELLAEGMPVEELHRLCDLHVGVFRAGLDDQAPVAPPPGHPVHTYQAENRLLSERAQRWAALCPGAAADSRDRLEAALEELAGVEIHYTRKENQLFPYLERTGFTGPSQVMWAVHDDVRGKIKEARAALRDGRFEVIRKEGPELSRLIAEMIYKEERILFPEAMRRLTPADWREIRAGDDEIGYLAPPAGPAADAAPRGPPPSGTDRVGLTTGSLTLEQLDRMLLAMPVEFSFVDDQDVVRYYSGQAERVFPRSPGVIGRNVRNCHPPKSLAQVNAILRAFRGGTRDRVEFWIPYRDKFLYITYHAVRAADGRYLGALEVTMDASRVRKLTGEQRLLDWTE